MTACPHVRDDIKLCRKFHAGQVDDPLALESRGHWLKELAQLAKKTMQKTMPLLVCYIFLVPISKHSTTPTKDHLNFLRT